MGVKAVNPIGSVPEATVPDLDRTFHTNIHGGLDFNMKLRRDDAL